MKALKMSVNIGRDRKLVIDVPEYFRAGKAELILLAPEDIPGESASALEDHVQYLIDHSRNRKRGDLDWEIEAQRKSWE